MSKLIICNQLSRIQHRDPSVAALPCRGYTGNVVYTRNGNSLPPHNTIVKRYSAPVSRHTNLKCLRYYLNHNNPWSGENKTYLWIRIASWDCLTKKISLCFTYVYKFMCFVQMQTIICNQVGAIAHLVMVSIAENWYQK
jgi:hypothetical protein